MNRSQYELIDYRLEGKIHKKIILEKSNFRSHIRIRHPEITLRRVKNILIEPDYVFTPSRNSEDYYYEKKIRNEIYRVVISDYRKHIKKVVTAYKVNNVDSFTVKHIHCVYDKNTYIDYLAIKQDQGNDIDYFYDLFGVAK